MKIAVATEDNRGLEAVLSQHFGRCQSYTLVEVDNGQIGEVKVHENPFYGSHGQPGEVPAFIKSIGAHVIIAGGMGPKAIGFFEQYGIQVATGVSGTVRTVLQLYLDGKIQGAAPCMDHEHEPDHEFHELPHDEPSKLREEILSLRKQLERATERLESLEKEKNRY
ncbi:MAG: dinitrogenase iron-molybdenum cofactor biosynthesis protein [Deltaproteobacteria bacterium]|nr:MAG: dinitrogenase iron-molybdenum cofactor biosynthesis protein [Deltaproteobacteria bacterium]